MKIFLFAIVAAFGFQAKAGWFPVINCLNNQFVVNQGDDDLMGRATYQLVTRGNFTKYLLDSGVINLKDVSQQGEFSIRIRKESGFLMGFQELQKSVTGTIIYGIYRLKSSNGRIALTLSQGNRAQGEKTIAILNYGQENCSFIRFQN